MRHRRTRGDRAGHRRQRRRARRPPGGVRQRRDRRWSVGRVDGRPAVRPRLVDVRGRLGRQPRRNPGHRAGGGAGDANGRTRQHHRHRLDRRTARRVEGRLRIQRVQGRGGEPRAPGRNRPRGRWHPRQRHRPRPDPHQHRRAWPDPARRRAGLGVDGAVGTDGSTRGDPGDGPPAGVRCIVVHDRGACTPSTAGRCQGGSSRARCDQRRITTRRRQGPCRRRERGSCTATRAREPARRAPGRSSRSPLART